MPTQESTTNPGWPPSTKVGTSGSALARFPLDTAIALRRPDFTYCCAVAIAVYTSGICPPTTSPIACPPPLYGT